MEKMNEALEELKRVDHLIYVSLKYTRTVDVILNILNRMVDAYSLIVDTLIMYADDNKKIHSEPESAIERATIIKEIYANDSLIVDNMGLYVLLRKLHRAKYVERENEYRRHVTMKTIIDGREEIVNIDIITNYYLFQREFILHVKNIIDGAVEILLEEQPIGHPPEPEWMIHKEEEIKEPILEEKSKTKISHKTPPVKAQVKVRPITSAPRKRVPRPKKYKIQIPQEENAILRPPYEHDPKYNPHLREKAKKEALEALKKSEKKKKKVKKVKKPAKKAAKKKSRKKVKKVKKKVVKKKPKKKIVKKKIAKKPKKKVVKKVKKKVVKKVKKKAVKKKVVKKKAVKKKVVKKKIKKLVKKRKPLLVRKVRRILKKAVRR